MGEALGLAVCNEDEAGPYQAIPQPGAAWELEGQPACQPHEYLRGGTAKLLTLFRPATGEVRGKGVRQSTNAIRHPWLQTELTAILDTLPAADPGLSPAAIRTLWESWQEGLTARLPLPADVPPLRRLLILDNLTGHYSATFVQWLLAHGILPRYTPLAGSWLNMAESVQRILVRRALAGQQPQDAQEVITWLEATVRGWNAAPTPFVWGGKRAARRARSRTRRHALGGSGACTRQPLRRLRRSTATPENGNNHDN